MKKQVTLLLILVLFILTACGKSEETGDDTSGEAKRENALETAEQDRENSEEENKLAENTTQKENESEQAKNSSEKNTSNNKTDQKTENTAEKKGNSEHEVNYTPAEHCIMTQLRECEDVAETDQFQAYNDLVADGILPEAPGSGCLACAVKYSFEAKYGESAPLTYSILPHSDKLPADITDTSEFVQQYLFALPAYFNNHNEEALSFYLPGSSGYNALFANKASGHYDNHMTYSVFIDSVVENLNGSVNVYVTRTYSHMNTYGVFEIYGRYTVIEQDGRYYLTDYEELENTRIE